MALAHQPRIRSSARTRAHRRLVSTATTRREPDERTLLTSERVRAALAQPELYPHHPAAVDVRETHISYVFLAGEFATNSRSRWCSTSSTIGRPRVDARCAAKRCA